ncbi:MAG: tetratricopeptide repeat protein [Candidatus Hinthialibacter antarcticus]|nr:tetratricopeptide repeat protein [Candidatus Hinthialibacter antarcticus]
MATIDVSGYLRRGSQAVKDGEFELAERYFSQVLEQFPENAEAQTGLDSISVERARRHKNPISWYAGLAGGLVMKALGKTEKAYDKLKFQHQVKPTDAKAALGLARCAAALDKHEEAYSAYRVVLKQDSNHQAALREAAEVLVVLGRHGEASKLLQKLTTLRPNDDKLAHRMRDVSAMDYTKVGIPEDLKARRREMEKEKLDALDTDEFMGKLNKLMEAYKASPDNHHIGVEVAAHYLSGNHLKQASKVLALILDKNSEFEPAKREQARVWRRTGELDICVGLYDDLFQLHPDDLALADERLDAQIAHMESRRNAPQWSKEDFNRIEMLKLERQKVRIKLLEAILLDHPERHPERAELSELLLKFGRTQDAITNLQRLIHEPSWAGKGFFLLGQCFRAQKDLPLAVQQYEKSLEFFKNRGYSHVPTQELKEVYYYLGVSLDQLGDKKGAREAYGQIYTYDIKFKDVKDRYEALMGAS